MSKWLLGFSLATCLATGCTKPPGSQVTGPDDANKADKRDEPPTVPVVQPNVVPDEETRQREARAKAQLRANEWSRIEARRIEKERAELAFAHYRTKFILVDGKFIRLPDFDFRADNSNNYTVEQARALAKKHFGPRDIERAVFLLRTGLPNLEVGAFGIVDQFRVVQIIGDEDAIVSKVPYGVFSSRDDEPTRKTDSDEWVRLSGHSTQGMVDGKDYQIGTDGAGVRVAIVGTWRYATVAGATRTILLACPVRRITAGISRERFQELVHQGVNLTPTIEMFNLRPGVDPLAEPGEAEPLVPRKYDANTWTAKHRPAWIADELVQANMQVFESGLVEAVGIDPSMIHVNPRLWVRTSKTDRDAVLAAIAKIVRTSGRKPEVLAVSSWSNAELTRFAIEEPKQETAEEKAAREAAEAAERARVAAEKKAKQEAELAEAKAKAEEAARKNETAAAAKLKLAKQLINEAKSTQAKFRLEQLLKEYPDTEAAKEAKLLLRDL